MTPPPAIPVQYLTANTSAVAGTLSRTGTSTSPRSKTNRWCWNGVSGYLPWLRSPPKDIGMSQEMVKLYMANQQPQREALMMYLRPPPPLHTRPVLPFSNDTVLLWVIIQVHW